MHNGDKRDQPVVEEMLLTLIKQANKSRNGRDSKHKIWLDHGIDFPKVEKKKMK